MDWVVPGLFGLGAIYLIAQLVKLSIDHYFNKKRQFVDDLVAKQKGTRQNGEI